MAGLYIDTSALGRVLLAEPDAPAIRRAVGAHTASWSSELVVVELRRLGAREGLVDEAERLLENIMVHPVDREALEIASRIEPLTVRSLDAIHLQAATVLLARGEIAAMLTYDRQLIAGSRHHGLPVLTPSVDDEV